MDSMLIGIVKYDRFIRSDADTSLRSLVDTSLKDRKEILLHPAILEKGILPRPVEPKRTVEAEIPETPHRETVYNIIVCQIESGNALKVKYL